MLGVAIGVDRWRRHHNVSIHGPQSVKDWCVARISRTRPNSGRSPILVTEMIAAEPLDQGSTTPPQQQPGYLATS